MKKKEIGKKAIALDREINKMKEQKQEYRRAKRRKKYQRRR